MHGAIGAGRTNGVEIAALHSRKVAVARYVVAGFTYRSHQITAHRRKLIYRLVFYGQDRTLLQSGALDSTIEAALARSNSLYPFVGEEFYRTGELRNWRTLDDRSVTFGVAGVSLSRALTDLVNLVALVWHKGGGQVPTPLPTPLGHVGPTITKAQLGGGFPERDKPGRGAPAMPKSSISLPPP